MKLKLRTTRSTPAVQNIYTAGLDTIIVRADELFEYGGMKKTSVKIWGDLRTKAIELLKICEELGTFGNLSQYEMRVLLIGINELAILNNGRYSLQRIIETIEKLKKEISKEVKLNEMHDTMDIPFLYHN